MLEQIKQVCLTYVTQRYLWLFAALLSVMIVPNLMMAVNSTRSPGDAASVLPVLGMPLFFLAPFLVGQVKAQFAHSRARLTPQFFPAHLTVLCGILLTLLVVYPFTLASRLRFEPLGFIAIAFAIGVPMIWGAQLNRFSGMLISLITFYSLLTSWGQNWWMIQAAEHRNMHAAIVAAGLALIIAWLWRLCHLREEQGDYLNLNHMMVARRTGSEAIEQRRIVATQAGRNRLGAWIGDWWHDRLGGYYGGSKAGLARVLRYGLGAQPIEFQGLIFSAMVLSVGIFLNQYSSPASSGANFGAYFFQVQFAIMLPGFMAGELMAQRRPRIAFEMLLPLSRTQLIDGLFAGLARNSVVLWTMMNVSLGIVVAMSSDPILLRTIVMFVLLSASIMFASMAISLRVSIWPSRAKRMMVLAPSWVILLLPFIRWATLHEKGVEWPFFIVAIGLLAVGAWVLTGARRAWLDSEIV